VARRKAPPTNAVQLDRRLRYGQAIEPEIVPVGQRFRSAYDASWLQQMARGAQAASLASGITQRIETERGYQVSVRKADGRAWAEDLRLARCWSRPACPRHRYAGHDGGKTQDGAQAREGWRSNWMVGDGIKVPKRGKKMPARGETAIGVRRLRPHIAMETYVVGRWRKEPLKPLEDLEDNIFVNNPFLDDLREWRHSPDGVQFAELADALCDLMEDVQLDAKQRKICLA
jgi:hypothetical protein